MREEETLPSHLSVLLDRNRLIELVLTKNTRYIVVQYMP